MTIDTAKLREWVNNEYLPMSQMGRDVVKREVNQLCDELDQARADVLKLRDAYRDQMRGDWQLGDTDIREELADTEHYEEFRK